MRRTSCSPPPAEEMRIRSGWRPDRAVTAPIAASVYLAAADLVRCAGRTSPSGQRCAPEPDPVLRDRIGFGGALRLPSPPTAARARLRVRNAWSRPPSESAPSSTVSHRGPLGEEFGARLVRAVRRRAGWKDRLRDRTRAQADAARPVKRFDAGADHQRDRLPPPPVGQRLRAAAVSRVPAASAHRGGRNVRPGTARLPLHHRGVPPTERPAAPCSASSAAGTQKRTLLSFFDTAGEDLHSQQSIEQNVRYLGAADGVLLLLDPLRDAGRAQPGQAGHPVAEFGGRPYAGHACWRRVTDLLLANEGGKPTKKISKPLAIVFTKMDTLMHDLKKTSPLLRSPPQEP